MLKRSIPVIVIAVFLLALAPAPLMAGTLMLGAKAWFAVWGSEFGQTAADQANLTLDEIYQDETTRPSQTTANAENGKGYLAGPLVSYQTDDRLWTVSLAFMWFSSFSQDIKANLHDIPLDVDVPFKYDLELTRKETDIAVARSLTENWKVFAGYKRQAWESKFKAEIEGESYAVYDINLDMDVPTAGVGYTAPLTESLALGIQLGVLYVMPDFQVKDYFYDETINLDMKNTLGFNGEITLTWLVSESVALQGGYRYQYMKLEFDQPEGEPDIDPIDDTFQGVTVTAVYMMPVGS